MVLSCSRLTSSQVKAVVWRLAAAGLVISLSYISAKAKEDGTPPVPGYGYGPVYTGQGPTGWEWPALPKDKEKEGTPGTVPPGTGVISNSDYPGSGGLYRDHSQGMGADGGFPGGSPGDGRAVPKPPPIMPYQRAQEMRLKAGTVTKKAVRAAGPCWNHNLMAGVTQLLPEGSHLYFGFDLSSKARGDDSQLLRSVLLLILDNANQYFGSQPATTLAGQTMVDQHPGAKPLNYQFKYYDTLDDANSAAASDSAANKYVIPVTDEYLPIKGVGDEARFTVAAAETVINRKTGEFFPKHLYINFTAFDIIRQLAAKQFSGPLLDTMFKRAAFLEYVVGLRHEFGHLLGLDHQTYGEPLDDDGSPMAYEGTGRSIESANINFQAPFSPCDAMTFASH